MMQQTETYKLNKPESTDTFSVGPLNENADKIETALAALEGTAAAEAAARQALDQRVTALEVHKIAIGSYNAERKNIFVQTGFTPAAVIAAPATFMVSNCAFATSGRACGTENNYIITIVEGGFVVYDQSDVNKAGIYNYIAFG